MTDVGSRAKPRRAHLSAQVQGAVGRRPGRSEGGAPTFEVDGSLGVADESRHFVGRAPERARLLEVLSLLRAGDSAALVVAGEAGSGKTALLLQAEAESGEVDVLRVDGFEAEVGWGFAALNRLLSPFLGSVEELPEPQRAALCTVFGISTGAAPNRFLVGLATMSLLERAARRRPLLCLVDDLQWVDQESRDALLFVARRLDTEGIGLVLGVRGGERELAGLDGIPTLRLEPMRDPDMRSLLVQAAPTPPAPDVATRLVAESQGIPLALLEYVATLTRHQLTGLAADLPPALPVGERLSAVFGDHVARLPSSTQSLLLVLAAAGIDDSGAVAEACEGLGIPEDAAQAAVAEGVITLRPWMAFRHPLLRSVVYDGAAPDARRRTHRELATVADAQEHPEKAAWHLACATSGPDEGLAERLEATAVRAGERGGYATEAMYLTLAAQRSADGTDEQLGRLLRAAQAHIMAGNGAEAQRLLSVTPPPGVAATMVEVQRIEARLLTDDYRTGHEPALLLAAAAELPDTEVMLVRTTLFRALHAALQTRDLTIGTTLPLVARALLDRSGSLGLRPAPMDLLYQGLAAREISGYRVAAPLLKAGLARLHEVSQERLSPLSTLVLWMTMEDLWDDEFASTTWAELTSRSHDQGAWPSAWTGWGSLATTTARHGDFEKAQELYDQAASVLAGIGSDPRLLWAVLIEFRAWQGQEDETRSMAATLTHLFGESLGHGSTPHFASAALTVLELSLGHYSAALVQAVKVARADPPGHGTRILPDLIEAATRTGASATADDALEVLTVRAGAADTAWAHGVLARSRALVSGTSKEAETHFERALALLAGTALKTEVARTRLLYGEWLRRQRRRREAHLQLSTALTAFTDIGAAAFAERAAIEVAALGVTPPIRQPVPPHELTAQELRVARLAARGMTNMEISEQLFITRSTVDYHMGKVFRKLQITSRRRLRDKLPPTGPAAHAQTP